MIALNEGKTVIVSSTEDTATKHQVGVIVKRFTHNKRVLYDVLLESRSAISALTTAPSSNTYINRELTERLCETDCIVTTIPYQHLLENDLLPDTRS